MDVKVNYSIKLNPKSFGNALKAKVMTRIESAVRNQVDAYLTDLERHMGGVHGGRPYKDGKVSWDALDETQLKEAPKFWIESGKAKRSISVNLQMEGNSINAFVGVSSGAEGYQEVLWNELGFTPQNGDKLIRRPLFIPLAEVHKAELQEKLRSMLQNTTIRMEIK